MIDIFGRKKRKAEIERLRAEYDKKAIEDHRSLSELNGAVLDHPEFGRIGIVVPGLSFTGPDRTKLHCDKCGRERTFSHLRWQYYYCERCLHVRSW
jgi:hypothetical protein